MLFRALGFGFLGYGKEHGKSSSHGKVETCSLGFKLPSLNEKHFQGFRGLGMDLGFKALEFQGFRV